MSLVKEIKDSFGGPQRKVIVLENGLSLETHRQVIKRLGLQIGKSVSANELKREIKKEEFQLGKEYAFKLLGYRARSSKELEGRLRTKGIDDKIIPKVLQALRDLKLVDDNQFADSWIRSRMATKPMGRARLRRELLAKGIKRQVIEEAIKRNIGAEDELKIALEVARERLRRHYRSQDWLEVKRKLLAFLQFRGFAYEIVTDVVRKLGRELGKNSDF